MNDVISRIERLYPQLMKAEKRIADLILGDAEDFLRGAITDTAEDANVSASSITRFSRMLDLDGFKDLKLSTAQARSAQSPYFHRSVQHLGEGEIAGGRLESNYLQQIVSALYSANTNLDPEKMVDSIQVIDAVRRTKVFGSAMSSLIAQELAMCLMRLGLEVSHVSDSHFQRIAASLLDSRDVAICVSHTGRLKEVLEVAETAKQRGATVIGLTSPQNPLSRKVDILLEVSVFEEIDIYTPSISHFVNHYLIGLLVFHIGQSEELGRDALLDKISAGLAGGLHSPS